MQKARSTYRLILAVLVVTLAGMILTPAPRSIAQTSANDQADAPAPTMAATSRAAAMTQLPKDVHVAIVRVEGEVSAYEHQVLQKRMEEALAGGAQLIVIDIDTPGGHAYSALQSAKYIKNLPVPTVAWINPHGYSAGIIIASACDVIVMAPSSATGDSAPIAPGMSLSPTERAKAVSPVLAEFRDSAKINGYDHALFHAMTVLGVKLYMIEHGPTGIRHVVNEADYQFLVDAVNDPQAAIMPDRVKNELSEGMTAEDMGEVTREFSMARPSEAGQWKLVRQIHDGSTLLTLTGTEAKEVGLSSATIASDQELKEFLSAASMVRYEQSVGEGVAWFLTSPLMKGIFLCLLFIGIYLEMLSPGLGLGGVLALAALVGLIAPPLLIGMGMMWHVLLFFIGALLLAVEIFVVPGFGAFGIAGIVCMVIGATFLGVPTGDGGVMPAPEFYNTLKASAAATIAAVVVAIGSMIAISKYSGRLPLLGKFVLPTVPKVGEGTGESLKLSGSEVFGRGQVSVGDKGRTTSRLRPTGVAEINGLSVDVTTPGEWIDAGKPVVVVEVHGNTITVEPAGS